MSEIAWLWLVGFPASVGAAGVIADFAEYHNFGWLTDWKLWQKLKFWKWGK